MKIRNINPQGDVQVAALNGQLVKRGEVVDVSEEIAALLLIQTVNWALPEKAPKADQKFAEQVIAEHLAALEEASRPPVEFVDVEAEPAEVDADGIHATIVPGADGIPVLTSIETPGEGEQA